MYHSYIDVNRKFKSSVNLQFDLNNSEKILQYVPTTDLCDVIRKYLVSILKGEGIKSTLLAGPYGKGKSYLMLVIIYLLSKNKDKKVISQLVNKISKVDNDLARLIELICDKNITLLPVIINNNESDDINQNFMLALRNALVNEELESIVPESTFAECVKQIELWENNKEFDLVEVCERKFKTTIKEIKDGLLSYRKKSYDLFLEMFECINHGYKFNSLVGNDISNIYQSLSKKLNERGYAGIFVIFDEFGVFLENKTVDFSQKLNKIQQFAERCNSSPIDAQVHLCCITHKDITLYQKDQQYSDDFAKISGRFKQIRFDRSLDENYQIICNAISKGEKYKINVREEYAKLNDFCKSVKQSNLFSNEKQLSFIMKNGFPINPVSFYVLIQISEKIAQNERTLFTFISDADIYSFRYFIANNESGLLNVDYIYNYFENTIKNNLEYKSLFYKVESLSRIDLREDHHSIFKCIALMKIINDDIKYRSTVHNIAISLGKSDNAVKKEIEELISYNILKESLNDHSIDFALIADKDVNNYIENVIASKVERIPISDLLDRFDKDRYVVSHKYNYETSMTRYFYSIYLIASKFVELNNFSYILDEALADGIIINLINDIDISKEEILNILKRDNTIDSYRVIVRVNDKSLNLNAINKLRKVFASENILNNKNDLKESDLEVLKQSMTDMISEINEYLQEYNNESICVSKSQISCDIKDCIYKSLIKVYPKTIVLNNEQINKNIISAVTTKARNNVIDDILEVRKGNFGPTSAEGTIFASFNRTIEKYGYIIENIQNLIIGDNGKTSASTLVDYLAEAPYGMRKGIIPLFIAKAIKMMSFNSGSGIDTVLLYNESIQVALDSTNLTKMMGNPSKFYFRYKRINKERIHFVEQLCKMFKVDITRNFNDDIKNVVLKIKSYVSNLEQTIIKTSTRDNVLSLKDESIKFKDLFLKHDINYYDVLFEGFSLFGKNFDEIIDSISNILIGFDNSLKKLYLENAKLLRNRFGSLDETIKSNYENWKQNNRKVDNIIFDTQYKRIYNALETSKHNDNELLDKLSVAILNSSLRDWNTTKKQQFYDGIDSFIKYVANYKSSDINKDEAKKEIKEGKLSRLGITLYTNLQDVMEEYGTSISNEEKVNVLRKLLKDILD